MKTSDKVAELVADLEDQFADVVEELQVADKKIDELETQLENLTEEHEALKQYVQYIETVYPELDMAYQVMERIDGTNNSI